MVAESACIPVPSELIMPFGGALAAGAIPGTHLNLVAVIIAGVAGNVAGSYIAWAVGRYGGQPALRRWGRRVWLREHDLTPALVATPCAADTRHAAPPPHPAGTPPPGDRRPPPAAPPPRASSPR